MKVLVLIFGDIQEHLGHMEGTLCPNIRLMIVKYKLKKKVWLTAS